MTDEDWAKKYDAPKGHVWQCMACGKKSKNRANGLGHWDESCFLNSQLVEDK